MKLKLKPAIRTYAAPPAKSIQRTIQLIQAEVDVHGRFWGTDRAPCPRTRIARMAVERNLMNIVGLGRFADLTYFYTETLKALYVPGLIFIVHFDVYQLLFLTPRECADGMVGN